MKQNAELTLTVEGTVMFVLMATVKMLAYHRAVDSTQSVFLGIININANAYLVIKAIPKLLANPQVILNKY